MVAAVDVGVVRSGCRVDPHAADRIAQRVWTAVAVPLIAAAGVHVVCRAGPRMLWWTGVLMQFLAEAG